MKLIIALLSALILFLGLKTDSEIEYDKTWANAKWIALEKLNDSLIVIPGIHGSGDNLGEKCVKRSVVPMFRKEFKIAKDIEQASINISGIGHYELSINGKKIGDRFLSPGWTNYQKRYLYNNFDITHNLRKGGNAIGVLVGNGFYNINRERYRKLVVAYGFPKLIFNITIKYKDGTVKNIISDESCRVSPSPITFSSIYGGEDYDANLEQEGWDTPGFDDSGWQKSVIISSETSKLVYEEDFPLKIMQEFETQNILHSKTGRTIYDFGQNASAIISLRVKGNRGAQIILRPDELLNSKGNITQKSGGGPVEFRYTLNGQGTELWQPRFTYYGFRYVDVEIIEPENANKKTEIVELKMLHTRNSSPTVGSFSCSDTLINNIFNLINWGIKSNMASVATDCPHREKLGWLEQTYLIGPSMHYNFNIHLLYRKIVADMIESQLDNGLVPDIAPEFVPFERGFRDSPEWGSASVIIPWQLYKWYGDKEIVKKAYPMMKKYVGYLQNKSKNNILEHGLGDWYDLGPKHPGEAQLTPKAVTATSIYFYDLLIISQAAKIQGLNDDSERYGNLAADVKKAFLKKFYNAKTGVCSTGSQTAYAMPLYTGLIPAHDKEKVLNNLIQSIENSDYALTSGDIGYHFLVRVLSENGKSDILYKMNNRSDRPGYGYQLKQGATSLTESWAALPDVSNNHMMLGHLMEWFYNGIGGIYQAKNSIAYSNIIIAPKPVGEIKWANCSYNSIKGIIRSNWNINKNSFTLIVEIPDNSNAKVILPTKFSHSTPVVANLDSGKPVDIKVGKGVLFIGTGKFKIISKRE